MFDFLMVEAFSSISFPHLDGILLDGFYSHTHVLISISFLFFFTGLLGICSNKKSILLIMLMVELVYYSSILMFLATSCYVVDLVLLKKSYYFGFINIKGQVNSILLLGIAACDSVLGLSLVYIAYARRRSIFFDQLILKG
jgi:NADH:ubiquinone oxidoreductase subunit K